MAWNKDTAGSRINLYIGLFLVFISFCFSVKTLLFLKKAVETTGTVVSDDLMSSSYRGGRSYDLKVKFTLPNGTPEVFEYPCKHGSLFPGDNIDVLYDPADPKNVRLNNWTDCWQSSLLWLVFGIMFIYVYFVNKSNS